MDYSTHQISPLLLDEIRNAIQSVHQFGSVEIYVQNHTVTQITVRTIKKTSVSVESSSKAQPKKIGSTISIHAHANT